VPLIEHGAAEAAHMVEQLGHRAEHAAPAMRKIRDLLILGEVALWKRSGGKKWAPRADGTTPGILTGRLHRSLTEPEAEGAIREVHDDHLVFGTSLYWARFMQAGTTVNGAPHEPKRPVLVFRPTDRKARRRSSACTCSENCLDRRDLRQPPRPDRRRARRPEHAQDVAPDHAPRARAPRGPADGARSAPRPAMTATSAGSTTRTGIRTSARW
jgi:phage gpG-like protein